MPLISFGAILTFAENIEKENNSFYQKAVAELLPQDDEITAFFEQLVKDKEKQIKVIQRVRRENVSEMILEPINDFTRESFLFDLDNVNAVTPETIIQTASKIEDRNLRYYLAAAEKIKSLPEVSTALKQFSKKEKNLLKKINAL